MRLFGKKRDFLKNYPTYDGSAEALALKALRDEIDSSLGRKIERIRYNYYDDNRAEFGVVFNGEEYDIVVYPAAKFPWDRSAGRKSQ